jgi:hypothetical protein
LIYCRRSISAPRNYKFVVPWRRDIVLHGFSIFAFGEFLHGYKYQEFSNYSVINGVV